MFILHTVGGGKLHNMHDYRIETKLLQSWCALINYFVWFRKWVGVGRRKLDMKWVSKKKLHPKEEHIRCAQAFYSLSNNQALDISCLLRFVRPGLGHVEIEWPLCVFNCPTLSVLLFNIIYICRDGSGSSANIPASDVSSSKSLKMEECDVFMY